MPSFFAWLGSALATAAGELVIRMLIGAGLAIATYRFVVTPIRDRIEARLGAAGDLSQFVGWLGVDVAVTIVLSALAGRAAASAARAFVVKRSS